MARFAPVLFTLLITIAACDEQSAPCAADEAAGASSSSGGEASSTGTTEPQGPECVFALGQCWCDGEVTALVPADGRSCMCGDAVAPTDSCWPASQCEVVGSPGTQSCACGDFDGLPKAGDDGLCYCGQQVATPIADGCICGSGEYLDESLCRSWDGSQCTDPSGAVVPPKFADGACSCGMTVLEQEHCTG